MLLSHSIMSDSLQPHGLPCPLRFSWVCSNSCPLSGWFYPTISPSVIPFSSRLQSLPTSGSFPVSRLFASGSQIIGASVSASGLPMTIQGWFPSGLTGLVCLGMTPFNLEDRSCRRSDEVRHAACRWRPSPPGYPPPSGQFISRKLKCSLLFLCWGTARVFPEAMRGFLERRRVWSLVNFIQ